MKIHGKSQVDPCFGGILLIFVPSSYLTNLTLIAFYLPISPPPSPPGPHVGGDVWISRCGHPTPSRVPRRAAPGHAAEAVALKVRADPPPGSSGDPPPGRMAGVLVIIKTTDKHLFTHFKAICYIGLDSDRFNTTDRNCDFVISTCFWLLFFVRKCV